MYRLAIIISFLFAASFSLRGQSTNIYELLTEPSLSRPLTLHKGFLQFHGGYTHLNGNNYFNETGRRLPFSEAAKSIIENNYRFEISYGIIKHLEFYAGISYRNRFESFPSYEISSDYGISAEHRTYHQHGLSNLDIILKYRIPEIITGFDLYVYGGILAPVSSQHPKVPTHTIDIAEITHPDSPYLLHYEYNPAAGSPALFYSSGIKMRYATDKIGCSLHMNIQNPFSYVETYSWVARRYDEEFEYLQKWYFTRPKGLIFGGANIEAQIYPWFSINSGYQFYMETPGWSDFLWEDIALQRSAAGFVYAGFEIQVSTHLRLLQQVNIPIHGKSTYSEFGVSLGISYNLVPLKNLYY